MRGSVVKRGSTWGIRYDEGIDPSTGRRQQRWRSGFPTRKAAEIALTQALESIDNGHYVTPHRQTVGEFLTEWLEVRRSQLRPSTWDTYRRNIDAHVIPRIGRVHLIDLDAGQLQRMYSDLLTAGRRPPKEGRPSEVAETAGRLKSAGMTWRETAEELECRYPLQGPYTRHSVAALVRRHRTAGPANREGGLAPRTVAHVATIVKRALKDAVRWGRIVRNPADAVDPPRRTVRPELPAWEAKTLRRFLQAAEADGDRLAPLWTFLATTGVRRGEALGLRWADLNLETGVATIWRTLVTVGHVPTVSEPKTAAGRRSVTLDPGTIDVLRRHRETQAAERSRMGSGWTDEGLTFCGIDGRALHPDRVSRTFQTRVERWDCPRIPLHGLRHTWATLALQAGEHPRVVQERLGHSSITVTLGVYSHVIPVMHQQAADRVAGIIFGTAP